MNPTFQSRPRTLLRLLWECVRQINTSLKRRQKHPIFNLFSISNKCHSSWKSTSRSGTITKHITFKVFFRTNTNEVRLWTERICMKTSKVSMQWKLSSNENTLARLERLCWVKLTTSNRHLARSCQSPLRSLEIRTGRWKILDSEHLTTNTDFLGVSFQMAIYFQSMYIATFPFCSTNVYF